MMAQRLVHIVYVNFEYNAHVNMSFPADLLVKAAVHNVDVSTKVFKACSFTPVK